MKTIKYKVKQNNANTEYREVSEADKKWALTQAKRIKDLIQDCSTSSNSDLRSIATELTKSNRNYIRQGTGAYNSTKTIIDGVLDNMIHGTQRDFSDRTCRALEEAFRHAAEIFTTVEEVEWVEVDAIKQEPQAMDPPTTNIQSTLTDLFDVQEYKITVQRIR